jgi:hypothetical protein
MEIIGEYLKPLAEAADDSEEIFLGLVTYKPDSTRLRPQLKRRSNVGYRVNTSVWELRQDELASRPEWMTGKSVSVDFSSLCVNPPVMYSIAIMR